MNKKITIAIDGHSSCGKSTVAKQIAKKLKYIYVDSGAMYRAITLFSMEKELWDGEKLDIDTLQYELPTINITFSYDETNQKHLTWLNNELVEDKIRTIEVSENVSQISTLGFVREAMVAMQQKMGEAGGIVMDGRDIGTVVFPDAELKIFMTASVEVRAQRRFDELTAKGENPSLEEVKANIEKRDYIDQNREISPLTQAKDALVLDNSNLTREEQLSTLLEWVQQRTA